MLCKIFRYKLECYTSAEKSINNFFQNENITDSVDVLKIKQSVTDTHIIITIFYIKK